MKDKYCLLTNDVETSSIWFNSLRPETGYRVFKEGMPLLLELYSKYDIKSTFFFCGDIVKLYPDIVKMVLPFGHEVASHGMSHEVQDAFDLMPFEKQLIHLIESKKILEDLCGNEVVSFRAPALRVDHNTAIALGEAGYLIDSSVPSQRFDFFLSFGNVKKLRWLLAPRLPYRTRSNDLTRKGNGQIIEIPLSAMFLPYMSTTMRIFPMITKVQQQILHLESQISGKPLVFGIHPNEFIDESHEKRIISRRADNYLSYLFGDLLRSKLKTKNLGFEAISLYENLIKCYMREKYTFSTIKDFCLKFTYE